MPDVLFLILAGACTGMFIFVLTHFLTVWALAFAHKRHEFLDKDLFNAE